MKAQHPLILPPLPQGPLPLLVGVVAVPASLPSGSLQWASVAATCSVGLIAFSFLKRRKAEKPKAEGADATDGSDATDGREDLQNEEDLDQAFAAPAERDSTIVDLLQAASYPIKSREDLIRALGGRENEVSLPDSSSLPACEIADRSFSKAKSFSSAEMVLDALSRASWTTTVMSYVSAAPFPFKSEEQLPKALLRGYIEGVRISKLAASLTYPIPDLSELLSQLQVARFVSGNDAGPTPVEEGAVEEGAVEEGAVEEGAVEEGAVEEGALEERGPEDVQQPQKDDGIPEVDEAAASDQEAVASTFAGD